MGTNSIYGCMDAGVVTIFSFDAEGLDGALPNRTSRFAIAPWRSSFRLRTQRQASGRLHIQGLDLGATGPCDLVFTQTAEVLSNGELNRMESEFLEEIKL